jgi:glycosyltransferase involved in cell wall biosynthesis
MGITNFSTRDQSNNPQKRILFLSTLTPPYYGASLSSEMCLNILKEEKNFDIRNIKLNYSTEMSDVGKLNLKKIYGFFYVSRQIKKVLKQFDPEIIYFVPAVTGLGLIRDYYFLRIIKFKKKASLILHIRGQFKKKDWKNPFKRKLIKQLLECDRIIVLGPELIKNLNNLIKKENIYILPNAIIETLKTEEFEKITLERKLKKKLNILFLSNMQEAKGWFKVLEVCKMLRNSGIEFECHFVGKWSSMKGKKKFRDYVTKYNLFDVVHYHGQLLNKAKNNILSETDIFIYPTEDDACPRVIIEAMEYGIVTISNKEGTIPSMIQHGESGYVLNNNTVAEIYGFIIKLLDNALRDNMSIESRARFLEKFTFGTYRDNFIDIFNKN